MYFSPLGAGGGGGDCGVHSGSGISLFDGDKVAILAAVYIRDIMNMLPPELLHGIQVRQGW